VAQLVVTPHARRDVDEAISALERVRNWRAVDLTFRIERAIERPPDGSRQIE
jgi:hypothetical protein